GVIRVVCDIHSHMRAFVVVGSSPWVGTCDVTGHFRFAGVPTGRYRLIVWHEFGDPSTRTVHIQDGSNDLGSIVVDGPASSVLGSSSAAAPRRWSEVVARIGVDLSAALAIAAGPGDIERAVELAYDAYFKEFEASDFETAVRSHLGLEAAADIEDRFRAIAR